MDSLEVIRSYLVHVLTCFLEGASGFCLNGFTCLLYFYDQVWIFMVQILDLGGGFGLEYWILKVDGGNLTGQVGVALHSSVSMDWLCCFCPSYSKVKISFFLSFYYFALCLWFVNCYYSYFYLKRNFDSWLCCCKNGSGTWCYICDRLFLRGDFAIFVSVWDLIVDIPCLKFFCCTEILWVSVLSSVNVYLLVLRVLRGSRIYIIGVSTH